MSSTCSQLAGLFNVKHSDENQSHKCRRYAQIRQRTREYNQCVQIVRFACRVINLWIRVEQSGSINFIIQFICFKRVKGSVCSDR